jgi:hypothetical protein
MSFTDYVLTLMTKRTPQSIIRSGSLHAVPLLYRRWLIGLGAPHGVGNHIEFVSIIT